VSGQNSAYAVRTNIHKNGLRQGDALVCLLFNIALERVIRDAGINVRGTIFYKCVQILAYADDIDIIGRTQRAMKEAFISLEKAAKKMH
jgi:sorting nexin-29